MQDSAVEHQLSLSPPREQISQVRTEVSRYGDSALLVVAHVGSGGDRWQAVQSLADFVEGARIRGVEGVVATFDSVLIEFDFLETSADLLESLVARWKVNPVEDCAAAPRRLFRVPVRYGGEAGPDLESVAADLGLSVDDLIQLHTSVTWTVRFLGAPAAAPLHDGSPFSLPIPRCARPRTRVPGGSVALSGRQGVIYPVDSPGGWRLIGRTPLRITDFTRSPFAHHRPGDLLEFFPVSEREAIDPEPWWIDVNG